MQLDESTEVHLKAGVVVVQRSTIHNWANRGPKISPWHLFVQNQKSDECGKRRVKSLEDAC